MVWSSRNLTSGITTTLSYILGIPAHVIATDESTRVRGSYSPEIGRDGAFTLLVHGLTLEDDAIETEWICEMLLPFCREDRTAHSMIITGTLSRRIEPIKVYCDKMVCNCSLPSLLSWNFSLLLPVPPSPPTMLGLEGKSWVNSNDLHELLCIVDVIKPAANIYWIIDQQIQSTSITQITKNTDGKTFRLEGSITATFPRKKGPISVICSVTEVYKPEAVIENFLYKEIQVSCK